MKYKFSIMDSIRELLFNKSKKPEIKYKKVDHDLYKVKINDTEVYWINEKNMYEIQHLYAETFFPPWKNNHVFEYNACKICEGMNVIDAGCCEGFFPLLAFKKNVNKIIAIEPLPQLCHALNVTFENERKNGKFVLFNALLGNQSGEGFISYNSAMICNSEEKKTDSSIKIKKITIDELIEKSIVDTINFIKMDIEGGEMKALQGAKKTLLKQKPKLSIAVYHGYENAISAKKIILSIRDDYKIVFRGKYAYESPPRPYMLYAY